MGMAAFCAVLGTCIAVLDGYARALNHSWATAEEASRARPCNAARWC